MKTTYLFLIALLVFTSCKKQKNQSFFGRETDVMMPKALTVHPLDFCNDGNPVGGGSGYNSMICSTQANVVVSSNMSAVDFKALIESPANKTIFINSNVVIDLTTLTQTIFLPQNIVIASNRGVGGSTGQ